MWTFARFIAIVVAIYFSLLLLWPIFGDAYARSFMGTAHLLYHSIGSDIEVVFVRIEEQGGRDISMQIRNLRAEMMVERHIPSRYSGYLPMAMLMALTLATPLSWRRRCLSLAIGLLALHIYIFTVLLLTIVRMLSRDGPAQLFELSTVWDRLLEHVVYQTTTSPTFSALVPVVIWAAATFRRRDLPTFGQTLADKPSKEVT